MFPKLPEYASIYSVYSITEIVSFAIIRLIAQIFPISRRIFLNLCKHELVAQPWLTNRVVHNAISCERKF